MEAYFYSKPDWNNSQLQQVAGGVSSLVLHAMRSEAISNASMHRLLLLDEYWDHTLIREKHRPYLAKSTTRLPVHVPLVPALRVSADFSIGSTIILRDLVTQKRFIQHKVVEHLGNLIIHASQTTTEMQAYAPSSYPALLTEDDLAHYHSFRRTQRNGAVLPLFTNMKLSSLLSQLGVGMENNQQECAWMLRYMNHLKNRELNGEHATAVQQPDSESADPAP